MVLEEQGPGSREQVVGSSVTEAPDEQEGFANVLVRGTVVVFDGSVHDVSDSVDEDHHIFLQYNARSCSTCPRWDVQRDRGSRGRQGGMENSKLEL